MGHRGYSGNHPRFSKRADERYDAKEAYNKDLTASARLHYLENVRHDHDSPANMHTDAHMRRQAKRIAKRTKGDEQDIYYEMKSKKMSEKKDSPAKNIKSIGKTVRKLEGAKKELRDEYNELSKRGVGFHPNYHGLKKIEDRMDAINEHIINPFNDPRDAEGNYIWDSPAKNIKSIGKSAKKLSDAKKTLRDEWRDLSKRQALKHPNIHYPPKVEIQDRMEAIADHVINPLNDPFDDEGRDMRSPVKMEGKGCAKSEGGSGCVVKRGDEYVILNNKKGGIFQSGFKSKQAAERSLAGYHANK
jgi:hypothetical protein